MPQTIPDKTLALSSQRPNRAPFDSDTSSSNRDTKVDAMDRLTEMEAFATVVDQGGFTDAAKKMGISKSAVSKHVSSLEARLGARLLNRTTRRVSPTEIGLAYYDRARRVLNDAGEADALVTSMQSAPSGLLRISVATDFGVNHLCTESLGLMHLPPSLDHLGLDIAGFRQIGGLVSPSDFTSMIGDLFPIALWGRSSL
jgi:molybdenum-dependent DNA-binding transcriptional regulator ModE